MRREGSARRKRFAPFAAGSETIGFPISVVDSSDYNSLLIVLAAADQGDSNRSGVHGGKSLRRARRPRERSTESHNFLEFFL